MNLDHREGKVVSYLTERTGIPNPRAAMVNLVRQTFAESYDGEVPSFPIDLHRISAALGVECVGRHTGISSDAVLIPEAGTLSIALRRSREVSLGRQRFSWAHELCHTYFYRLRNGYWSRIVPGGSKLEEELCDLGAQELLMPEDSLLGVLESLRDPKLVTKRVLEAATRVSVSPSALLRRVKQLGFWENVAFACYMKHTQKNEMSLVPVWRTAATSPYVEFMDTEVWPPSILHHAFATRSERRRCLVPDWVFPRKRTLIEAKRYSHSMLLASAIRRD